MDSSVRHYNGFSDLPYIPISYDELNSVVGGQAKVASLAKGHIHRSLGHRPRKAKANESALAEGHIQTVPKWCVSLAFS